MAWRMTVPEVVRFSEGFWTAWLALVTSAAPLMLPTVVVSTASGTVAGAERAGTLPDGVPERAPDAATEKSNSSAPAGTRATAVLETDNWTANTAP